MNEMLVDGLAMMGDWEFSLYVGVFVFSLVLLIGLTARFVALKKEPLPAKDRPHTPLQDKSDLPSLDKPVDDGPAIKSQSGPTSTVTITLPPPTPAVPAYPFEAPMMWSGDDVKVKKKKETPKPVPTALRPAKKDKPASSDPDLTRPAEPPPPPKPPEKPIEKTVVIAPVEKLVPTLSAPSTSEAVPGENPTSMAPIPLKENGAVEPAQSPSSVDIQMFETLLRRISGLEAEMKKDPLYLDPLMKRVTRAEKKLEELALQPPPNLEVHKRSDDPLPTASGNEEELKALKEKVEALQNLLERLSEGILPPASPQ